MSNIDYVYKAKILNSGLCSKVKKLDKLLYNLVANSKGCDIPFEEAMFCVDNNCTINDVREARAINNANYNRVKRLKGRIEQYLTMGQCIWLTLTFTDEILAKTSQETRRRYVSRFLKSQSNSYIANIDYGKDTEREHYHAVVLCDYLDKSKWLYGFSYTERVKNHVNSPKKLSKYVSKLTNHAIKETTKRQVYIYSRS